MTPVNLSPTTVAALAARCLRVIRVEEPEAAQKPRQRFRFGSLGRPSLACQNHDGSGIPENTEAFASPDPRVFVHNPITS